MMAVITQAVVLYIVLLEDMGDAVSRVRPDGGFEKPCTLGESGYLKDYRVQLSMAHGTLMGWEG
jgi:hypothetical protein